ncbi:unnamed protein product, partial [Adineta ricciae]
MSEKILTAREKRVRQKFNSDIELQAYEKRLKDIEKKIRQLVKRAFEIFDENRTISSPLGNGRTNKTEVRSKSLNHSQDDSSIRDGSSLHRRDTEPAKKDSDTSSSSTQEKQPDIVTSDASDLECRVRAYREQLKAKKLELDRLKQRKNKEILRRQEDELKKQIESYDHEIQTLRLQPIQQEQTVPVPSASSSSSSSKKKSESFEKPAVQRPENEDKDFGGETLETPRDERDTQHDAVSISNTNDEPFENKSNYDSRRSSIDNDKLIQDFNTNLQIPSKENEDSVSSSSSISSATSNKPVKSQSPKASSSSSPVSSERSQSSSVSQQDRVESPIQPLTSEAIRSISSISQNRVKSPARSETSTPSYSSAHERIESPPPPAAFEPIVPPTQDLIGSASPPPSPSIVESIKTTKQEHAKSPSPPPLSASESSTSSTDKRVKSPMPPPEAVKSATSSISERIPIENSPSTSSSRSEHTKSSWPHTQDNVKSTASITQKRSSALTIERTQSLNNEYDEDFSEATHSPIETSAKLQIEDIDVESIQEDIEDKHIYHDDNRSSTSKSTEEEQSEILVLVKKSANTTPRQVDEHVQEDQLPPSSPQLQKTLSEDTSHDLSDADERKQQKNATTEVDRLTETLIKTFIDEAISQGTEIVARKNQDLSVKDETEGGSDEDLSDEAHNKEEDVDNVIKILAIQQEFLEQLDAAANGNNEQ